MLPLADPGDPRYTANEPFPLCRFLHGSRPEKPQSTDPEHKIIKSILNGWRPAGGHSGVFGRSRRPRLFPQVGRLEPGKRRCPQPSTSLTLNTYHLSGDVAAPQLAAPYMGWSHGAAAQLTTKVGCPLSWASTAKSVKARNGKWFSGLMGWNWTFGGVGESWVAVCGLAFETRLCFHYGVH